MFEKRRCVKAVAVFSWSVLTLVLLSFMCSATNPLSCSYDQTVAPAMVQFWRIVSAFDYMHDAMIVL